MKKVSYEADRVLHEPWDGEIYIVENFDDIVEVTKKEGWYFEEDEAGRDDNGEMRYEIHYCYLNNSDSEWFCDKFTEDQREILSKEFPEKVLFCRIRVPDPEEIDLEDCYYLSETLADEWFAAGGQRRKNP